MRRGREPSAPRQRLSSVQPETETRRFPRHPNSTVHRQRPRLKTVQTCFLASLTSRRPGFAIATMTAAIALAVLSTGCAALLLLGGAGTSAIAFATGELRLTEETSLGDLDTACAVAVDVLGYDEVETERDADRIRWRARTASGDPVDIQLLARGPTSTELRIRIGVFGDEAKSRLVLEQIHQAL